VLNYNDLHYFYAWFLGVCLNYNFLGKQFILLAPSDTVFFGIKLKLNIKSNGVYVLLQLLMNSRKRHCLSMRLNYPASVGIYLKVCNSYFLCLIYYILPVETLHSTILCFPILWASFYSVIVLFECFVGKFYYEWVVYAMTIFYMNCSEWSFWKLTPRQHDYFLWMFVAWQVCHVLVICVFVQWLLH